MTCQISLSLLLLVLSAPVMSQTKFSLEALVGQELFLRETPNTNRKVYVKVGNRESYYIHSKSRLFPVRKTEPILIRKVKEKQDHVEVEFSSKYLGKGKIQLYGATTPELLEAAIQSAFSESPEADPELVLNRESGFIHFLGCNHLPPPGQRQPATQEALASGNYQKCPLCFSNVPKISGYDLEMRLSEGVTGAIHARYPLVTDDEIQNRVRRIGEKVLSNWVIPLKGYTYRFYAVDSGLTNAFACPGGKIYMTTALLQTLESDEELGAILAHEIAHVELRHGYRQFRSFQKAQLWAGIAAALAGAATKSSGVMNLVNMIAQLSAGIVMTGHSRRYESEADAFANIYLESRHLNSGRQSFSNVLRKLQYHQDFYDPENKGSSFLSTHPEIKARIDTVENSEMAVFGPEETFFGYNKQEDLVATIFFQGQRRYTGRLNSDDVGLQIVALVETTSALGDKAKIKDIRIKTNGKRIKLDNKEDTEVLPNDAVGASFVSKDVRRLIDEIEHIDLDLRNVVRWEKQSAALRN